LKKLVDMNENYLRDKSSPYIN